MKFRILIQKVAKTFLVPLIVLGLLSGSSALALDDISDCNYDFFTGYCTGGGPYDEPHPAPEIEYPEPPEPTPHTPIPAPPPVVTPHPQPAPQPIEPPPICERKPSLPQCN